jgi:anhydro-N-acetylmuramic acid kinase
MVIDSAVSRATSGRLRYDRDGRLAARGRVEPRLLSELMRHPFLRRRPPKSTGREEFGSQFAEAVYQRARRRGVPPLDVLATVTAFTAKSIAQAYRQYLPRRVEEVLLCGGGARNGTLVRMLREELPAARVRMTDELDVPVEAKEAVSFALLAAATIRGEPGNVPRATGARRPVLLGKIVPAC